MARRTKAQWQALIEAHSGSGQTATAFCREHDVNAKYCSLRRRQLSDAHTTSRSGFTPVSFSTSGGSEPIRVELPGGAIVRLSLSVEPEWLASLLHELRD